MTSMSMILLACLCFFKEAMAAYDSSSKSNIAVYWGQNSGLTQGRLLEYCTDDVDIVLLSFMTAFPNNLALNFANQCGSSFSDGLLHCSTIGEDIKTCQKSGTKVLLSLGGASGSYGFSSDSDAEDFAETLWNKFGGGSDDERPFDDAKVDGFDFDIENNNDVGYAALSTKLREYFAKDSSKEYYISAAPQCPYPDASVGDLLSNADVDFVFIQFYNNYCSLGSSFNFDTWQDYASNTSPNKNTKLFVGLPGAQSSAGSGYVLASTVEKYISEIYSSPNFAGISLWDASSSFSNVDSSGKNFVEQMKDILTSSSSNDDKLTSSSSYIQESSSSSTETSYIEAASTSSASSSSLVFSPSLSSLEAVLTSYEDSSYAPGTLSSVIISSARTLQETSSAFTSSVADYTPSEQQKKILTVYTHPIVYNRVTMTQTIEITSTVYGISPN